MWEKLGKQKLSWYLPQSWVDNPKHNTKKGPKAWLTKAPKCVSSLKYFGRTTVEESCILHPHTDVQRSNLNLSISGKRLDAPWNSH